MPRRVSSLLGQLPRRVRKNLLFQPRGSGGSSGSSARTFPSNVDVEGTGTMRSKWMDDCIYASNSFGACVTYYIPPIHTSSIEAHIQMSVYMTIDVSR